MSVFALSKRKAILVEQSSKYVFLPFFFCIFFLLLVLVLLKPIKSEIMPSQVGTGAEQTRGGGRDEGGVSQYSAYSSRRDGNEGIEDMISDLFSRVPYTCS